MTMSFLESFIRKTENITAELSIEEKKKLIFIEELIFSKSAIYLNLTEKEIIEKLTLTDSVAPVAINIYLKKIASVNKIRSCIKEWNNYTSGNVAQINSHEIIPNFILCHADDNLCKQMEENYGIITISKELNIKHSNHIVQNKIIGETEISDPFSFFRGLSRCHSVVIIEPYLLKQDYGWIKQLVKGIIGENFKAGPIKIMMITRSGEGNLNHINRLKDDFSGEVIFEHLERINLHDRYIFTNSYWVSSDYGFMKRYTNGGTKWTNYPLGLYYDDFYDRLSIGLSFLKSCRHRSTNYLAKGFCA